MVMCWVVDCKHYSDTKTCKFFRFPKDEKTKQKWIDLIRRADTQPTTSSVVCSCHFVDGNKENLPTIFNRNIEKVFKYRTPEKRKQRKIEGKKTTDSCRRELFSTTEEPSTSHQGACFIGAASIATGNQSPSEELQISSRSSSGLRHDFEDMMIEAEETHKEKDISALKKELLELKGTLKKITGTAQQEAQIYFLQKENEELKQKLEKLTISFSFEYIKHNDQLIYMYTGIPNKYLFDTLYELFEPIALKYSMGWTVGNISKKDQLLLTLMKLRRNLLNMDLSCRYNVSTTTISNILTTWIHALHEILFVQLMQEIPSRQKNQMCMPACFSVFSNCRIVLDCTEMHYVKPRALDEQKLTYSSYKHQNTVKALVGVAPNGVITFLSDLYPGSLSDKKIVEDSGIVEKMVTGDLIIADKGFLIKDMLPAGVNLNLPPFLTTAQFTSEQAVQTRTIARARIHVERAIRRLKCFSILNNISSTLAPQATKIFQVCGALTNFQFPLIAEVEDLYGNTNE